MSVEPKVRRLEYSTESLTIKYIPGFEEKYQELENNGDFFASLKFAYENLVSRHENITLSIYEITLQCPKTKLIVENEKRIDQI